MLRAMEAVTTSANVNNPRQFHIERDITSRKRLYFTAKCCACTVHIDRCAARRFSPPLAHITVNGAISCVVRPPNTFFNSNTSGVIKFCSELVRIGRLWSVSCLPPNLHCLIVSHRTPFQIVECLCCPRCMFILPINSPSLLRQVRSIDHRAWYTCNVLHCHFFGHLELYRYIAMFLDGANIVIWRILIHSYMLQLTTWINYLLLNVRCIKCGFSHFKLRIRISWT